MDVEGAHMMRQADEVGAWRLVGAGVGDVEHRLVPREREPVRLVEAIGDHRGFARGRVVAIHEGADFRRSLEALDLAIVRIGEPHRAIALYHHVVRRVEAKPAPLVDYRFDSPGFKVHAADAGRRLTRALLADHEPAVAVEGHAVGHVRGKLHRIERLRRERKLFAAQLQPLDGDVPGSGLGHGGEIERMLCGDIDRPFMGVRLRQDGPLKARAEYRSEVVAIDGERRTAAMIRRLSHHPSPRPAIVGRDGQNGTPAAVARQGVVGMRSADQLCAAGAAVVDFW